MDELDHLRKLWAKKAKRSTKLIVGSIAYEGRDGHFEGNKHWDYVVDYPFRSALDIQLTTRKKNKKSFQVWTQGPLLSFDVGDRILKRDGSESVMVTYAMPMGWDAVNDEMYQGVVAFDKYDESGAHPIKTGSTSLSQMEFLELLIHG